MTAFGSSDQQVCSWSGLALLLLALGDAMGQHAVVRAAGVSKGKKRRQDEKGSEVKKKNKMPTSKRSTSMGYGHFGRSAWRWGP